MKALTPAHVEKGRLHHPCGSLRQLTAGWVKVGLQRRCLTPCCAALPAPPLTALVAGRLGGWPLAAVSAALFSLSTWDGRQHSAAGQTQVTWRLLPSQLGQNEQAIYCRVVSSKTACAAETSFKGIERPRENDDPKADVTGHRKDSWQWRHWLSLCLRHTQVRGFPGCCRNWIPKLSSVAPLLCDYLRQSPAEPFWEKKHSEATETLKHFLAKALALGHPSIIYPFILFARVNRDAALGVLTQ